MNSATSRLFFATINFLFKKKSNCTNLILDKNKILFCKMERLKVRQEQFHANYIGPEEPTKARFYS